MIVEFEYQGEQLEAEVTKHGYADEERRPFPDADYRYDIRWIADGAISDLRAIEGCAIAEFEARAEREGEWS